MGWSIWPFCRGRGSSPPYARWAGWQLGMGVKNRAAHGTCSRSPEDLVEGMANMDGAVGVRRAVAGMKGLPSFVLLENLLVDMLFFPLAQTLARSGRFARIAKSVFGRFVFLCNVFATGAVTFLKACASVAINRYSIVERTPFPRACPPLFKLRHRSATLNGGILLTIAYSQREARVFPTAAVSGRTRRMPMNFRSSPIPQLQPHSGRSRRIRSAYPAPHLHGGRRAVSSYQDRDLKQFCSSAT